MDAPRLRRNGAAPGTGAAPTDRQLRQIRKLLGAAFTEPTLIRIGRAFQEATDWHKRQPDLSGF